MRSLTGLLNSTWWPVMTADTTAPSYWLNWRFLLCAICILMAMVLSALVIWRYEGHNKSRSRPTGDQGEAARGSYKSEAWRTCSQSIHPIWLLAYRIVAFCALLALILADTIVHSVGIFYFYTQWTFTLVTFYFGLASSLSIHGHLLHRHEVDSEKDNRVGRDAEQGSYVEPTHGENSGMPSTNKSLNPGDDPKHRAASVWENALQIMFQRFPFFRIAYFVLWTSVFVVFQWIIHAFVSMRWPYPFLDLSSPYAPIW
ncbi:hypothetical protein Sango_1077400 [Sesamum angolense]|uniref:Uncharacterized protein n=1 Tax=Sesamum angolense TaxID=2727404 RepID=A0AAE1WU49_9LAMI|nr:hypothetical protein Sango_1077400 [Sesamum angolense]